MEIFGQSTVNIMRVPRFRRAAPRVEGTGGIADGQLEALLEQVENATRRAQELVAGRSLTDLTTSLDPTGWSVVQCLDHLAQTTSAFVPALSAALVKAPRIAKNRTLRTGALTRVFLRNLEPPYRLRFKVLARLVPGQRDFNSAWSAFEESQVQLAKTIRAGAGLAIDRVKIESPVYARLRYNLYGAFRMLVAHQRRHLWQVEQILSRLDTKPVRSASQV